MRFPLYSDLRFVTRPCELAYGERSWGLCFGWPASTRMPGPLPPRGEGRRNEEMKMERSWVAWTAALLLTAILLLSPRESAAGPYLPYIVPDPQPGGPLFGEPDVPADGPNLRKTDALRLRLGVLQVWVRWNARPVVILLRSETVAKPLARRVQL